MIDLDFEDLARDSDNLSFIPTATAPASRVSGYKNGDTMMGSNVSMPHGVFAQ